MTTKSKTGSLKLTSNRITMKNRKQLQDISPAPVPRSSHRIRTLSTDSDEKVKINLSPRRYQSSASSTSSSQSSNQQISKGENSLLNGLNFFGRVSGICPLANLGNTCFLNSVLYALRFLPGFSHDLHHLYTHLKSFQFKEDSSLKQRFNFLQELHSVFSLLRAEEKSSAESKRIPALHPIHFLESVRSVNPFFEGNRQQDAHELLHCLLDQLFNLPQDLRKEINDVPISEDAQPPQNKRRKRADNYQPNLEDSYKAFDVVGTKFVGEMVLETRCVECEQTNSRKETFLEVCVPVKKKKDIDDDEEISDTDVLLTALCKEEGLVGSNKYWCEFCCHHNEAERFVHFQRLPHNLLIHIKRFSSFSRTLAGKCCDAMPAPFKLPCFCQECLIQQRKLEEWKAAAEEGSKEVEVNSDPEELFPSLHFPYYLRAFICHLGATISSGHYISFVHVSHQSSSCVEEERSICSRSHNQSDCSFLSCCGSHLDRILPSSPLINGHSGDKSKSLSVNGVWLECDDEKIKAVSHNDVTEAMNSSNLTPYMLFYSR